MVLVEVEFPGHDNPIGRRIARYLELNFHSGVGYTREELNNYSECVLTDILSDFKFAMRLTWEYDIVSECMRSAGEEEFNEIVIINQILDLNRMRDSFAMSFDDDRSPAYRRLVYLFNRLRYLMSSSIGGSGEE